MFSYVQSRSNPVDLLSRGLKADSISSSSLWWSGPTFLLKGEQYWPKILNSKCNFTDLISCPTILQKSMDVDPILNLVKNKSNFIYLQRSIAYLQRFKYNCRNKTKKLNGLLTVDELQSSLLLIICKVQSEMFPGEYSLLKKGKILPKKKPSYFFVSFYRCK